jgi:hypothetical protein
MTYDASHVLIETLREDIKFLREQNKELTERVMSFSGQAHQAYITRDIGGMAVPAPKYLDEITGKIESMSSETEEEKKDKEQALEMIGKLLTP